MSKFKLIQKGWEGYTGDIGQVQFENGITVDEYPQTYIDRVAASFQIIDAETDEPAGITQRLIGAKALACPVGEQLDQMTTEQIATTNAAAAANAAKTLHPSEFLTQSQLEAIVDARGIQGLREIAQPYGVKAKSINDLMIAVLNAQDVVRSTQAAAAPIALVEEPAAPVEEPAAPEETAEEAAPADETAPPADAGATEATEQQNG